MKKTRAVFVFLMVCPFLYLSKAQEVRFLDSKSNPVEGLIVSVQSLNSPGSDVLITDNRGFISIKTIEYPLLLQAYLLGYVTIRDTLFYPEQRSYTLETNNVNLDEVTVTGNYGRTDKSVFQTEVITKEQINAQAANNLQDLFTHQLSMRVSNDAVTGSNVSIQGISGENIKILIDGVPVIGRLNNNINLSQLNLNNISRVEVIKGPASVLYGTNALGGVINIITDASTNPPLKAGVNMYYETSGHYNADAYANLHFKKADVSISGGRYFFDGWSEEDLYRDYEWKPKEQRFGNIRLSKGFKRSRLTFQSRLFDETVIHKSSVINGWPAAANAFDRYYRTLRFNNEIQGSHHFNSNSRIELTGAYSFYRYSRLTYIKNLVELEQTLADDPLQHDTSDFGAAMVRMVYTKEKPDAMFNYQAGVDLNNEYTTGRRIEGHKKTTGDYAAFASIEFRPVQQLLVKPSVRATHNTTYSAPVVPSVQVLYELKKNVTVRASAAKGFRSPSLKELYLEFDDDNHDVFGNKLLLAEKSYHYHASIDWKLKSKEFTFTITPSAFYNDIKNKISLVSHNDIYTYLNFYEYITRGGQLTASVKFREFELTSGYSYTGINNSEVSADAGYLYASEVNTMLQYKIKKTKTLMAVFWKYNGRQPQYIIDENDDVKVFNGESYSMADASITQPLFNDRITLSTGVKNILNVTSIKNQDPSGGGTHQASEERVFTGMGRNIFVRLQYQFSK